VQFTQKTNIGARPMGLFATCLVGEKFLGKMRGFWIKKTNYIACLKLRDEFIKLN